MNRPLLNPDELAEMLHVPRSTLYGWRQTGDGPPAIKVGRLLRYDPKDVELWLAQQRERSK